jgi:hypothetical protein
MKTVLQLTTASATYVVTLSRLIAEPRVVACVGKVSSVCWCVDVCCDIDMKQMCVGEAAAVLCVESSSYLLVIASCWVRDYAAFRTLKFWVSD